MGPKMDFYSKMEGLSFTTPNLTLAPGKNIDDKMIYIFVQVHYSKLFIRQSIMYDD